MSQTSRRFMSLKSALKALAIFQSTVPILLVAITYSVRFDHASDAATVSVTITWLAELILTGLVFWQLQAITAIVLILCVDWSQRYHRVVVLFPMCFLVATQWCQPSYQRTSGVDQRRLATTKTHFRVLSFNLLFYNRRYDQIIDEVRAQNPDVVLFQEFAPHHLELTRALKDRFPNQQLEPRDSSFGMACLSQQKMHSPVKKLIGHTAIPLMHFGLKENGVKFRVVNVHLLPPRRISYVRSRAQEWKELQQELLTLEHEGSETTIVAGDFNQTTSHRFHRDLVNRGFSHGFNKAGRGARASWPTTPLWRILPGLELDHIYSRGEVRFVKVTHGKACGSDHRMLIADVELKKSGS